MDDGSPDNTTAILLAAAAFVVSLIAFFAAMDGPEGYSGVSPEKINNACGKHKVVRINSDAVNDFYIVRCSDGSVKAVR